MTYALDTNIVSYFIREDKSVLTRFRAVLAMNNSIVIPPVTYYEIRRGFRHKEAHGKEQVFNRMCKLYPIGEMSLSIWECAAQLYADLRKAKRTVEDADILIAAFCIVNGYTLVTHNTKHFEDIDELKVEDWSA